MASCVEQGRAWTTPILQEIAEFRQQFEQFVQEAKESTEVSGLGRKPR
jgi:hypothetical protein